MIKNIRIPNETLDYLNFFRGVDISLSEIIRRGVRKWIKNGKPDIKRQSKKQRRGRTEAVALEMTDTMIEEITSVNCDFTTMIIGIMEWCIAQYPKITKYHPSDEALSEQRYLDNCRIECHKLQSNYSVTLY